MKDAPSGRGTAFHRVHPGNFARALDIVIIHRIGENPRLRRAGREKIAFHAFDHVQLQIADEPDPRRSNHDRENHKECARLVPPKIGPDFFPTAAHAGPPRNRMVSTSCLPAIWCSASTGFLPGMSCRLVNLHIYHTTNAIQSTSGIYHPFARFGLVLAGPSTVPASSI